MKRIILTLFCGLCIGIAHAQSSNAEKKAEITKIKKSSGYIFAEATLPTPEAAKDLAEELLYNEINAWVASQKRLNGAGNVIVKDSKLAQQEISLPRGNMFRAFMYVKKSNIIAADNTTVIENETPAGTRVPQGEVEMLAPTGRNAGISQAETIPEAVAKIVGAKRFNELKPLFTSLKSSGDVTEYNLYSALKDASAYYLVVCDRQQNVIAVLTPEANGRKNLKTGAADSPSNYQWHGATIAFKLKK